VDEVIWKRRFGIEGDLTLNSPTLSTRAWHILPHWETRRIFAIELEAVRRRYPEKF